MIKQLQSSNGTAASAFRAVIRNKNFMTENLLGYAFIRDGVIEVTNGKFMDAMLWGVTVVRHGKHDDMASKCLFSIEDVEAYINELGGIKSHD
jgi:hypothetical protein